MAKLTLKQKLRSAHVKRWHLVRCAREQNIAEHMYQVNLIALHFADRIKIEAKLVPLVSSWALSHDLVEVITGDIATPTKKLLTDAKITLQIIEDDIDDELGMLRHSLTNYNPIVTDLVSLADTVEAVMFLSEEGIGEHSSKVLNGLIDDCHFLLKKLINKHPQYQWANVNFGEVW